MEEIQNNRKTSTKEVTGRSTDRLQRESVSMIETDQNIPKKGLSPCRMFFISNNCDISISSNMGFSLSTTENGVIPLLV